MVSTVIRTSMRIVNGDEGALLLWDLGIGILVEIEF